MGRLVEVVAQMNPGVVAMHRFASRLLRGNPLRDPHVRDIPVYVPHGRGPFPAILCLQGFTGFGAGYLNRSAWQETLPDRMDRLRAAGAKPAILVMADGFTKYGGSQYVNSSATGRYEDHLLQELIPWATRTFPASGRWGVFGKSSGGFGAIRLAMRHPDVFSATACHSGDMAFELCYANDFPRVAAALPRLGGTPRAFFRKFFASHKKSSDMMTVLNTLAMASCYSPRGRDFDLPFTLDTCEIVASTWNRWLAFDPLEMLKQKKHREALRRMRGVFLDCGTRDEYHLQFGARRFSRELKRSGIRHVHEEFEDGHMNIPYRYDRSLPLLSRWLS